MSTFIWDSLISVCNSLVWFAGTISEYCVGVINGRLCWGFNSRGTNVPVDSSSMTSSSIPGLYAVIFLVTLRFAPSTYSISTSTSSTSLITFFFCLRPDILVDLSTTIISSTSSSIVFFFLISSGCSTIACDVSVIVTNSSAGNSVICILSVWGVLSSGVLKPGLKVAVFFLSSVSSRVSVKVYYCMFCVLY